MLEKPPIPDKTIIACLKEEYGLPVTGIEFLPLGADQNAAVYRSIARDGTPYFVKLRQGVIDEATIALPRFLYDQGISQVMAPLPNRAGRLWAKLDLYKVIVYPFIEGNNAAHIELSEQQWHIFGAALKAVHETELPVVIKEHLPCETFSAQWRENVKKHLENIGSTVSREPVAQKTAAFIEEKRGVILDLVAHAERFARKINSRSPGFVLCHSDIHEANVLVDAGGELHIVDWDSPILAPKERDLMYIGGGIIGVWNKAWQEKWFYQGYGPVEVDLTLLAYYRFERIIQDISIFCDQLLLTEEGGSDREQWFRYLASNFQPGEVLEIAYRTAHSILHNKNTQSDVD